MQGAATTTLVTGTALKPATSGVVRESVVAAVAATTIAALVAPGDMGLGGRSPHLLWLAVLVIAARYGTRGLVSALPIAWGVLAVTALFLRIDVLHVVQRMSSGPDVGALVAAVLVAWVASAHERRQGALAARAAALEERCARARAVAAELREAAVALRMRADRTDTPLAFLREIAARLEHGAPREASQAALSLALARTGARAGLVQMWDGERLRTTWWTGAWSADAPMPPELLRDETAEAAHRYCRAVRAVDLGGGGPEDSDMAAPVTDASGGCLGVLSLRGVPPEALGAASLHDLAVIARWCGQALQAASELDGRVVTGEVAPNAASPAIGPFPPEVSGDPAASLDEEPDPEPEPSRSISQLH